MNLAYYLIIAGVVLFAGVFVFQRFWRRAEREQVQRPPVPVNLASTTDAIFLSSGFGRITFASARAREWFGLDSGDPDLELLAELAHPSDVLRDLFAAEGRATLQVGYRQVDAASHLLPGESGRHLVVILRDMADSPTEYGPDTARALVALSRIGQQVSANTPLPDTLEFILDSLRQAIPYDAGQVLIQSGDTRSLQVLAQQGDFALLRQLTSGIEAARKGEGHTGWVVTYGEPLLVEAGGQGAEDPLPAFESYLGVPLTSGESFIGVLQVVKAEPHAFAYEDLTLLGAIANQTATAIDRARLYEDRVQRSNELAGVQAIARAAAEMTSRRDLFGALARHIAAALDVGQCGILIHDPDGQRLVPERPFVGVPDAVLEAVQFTLEEGGVTQRVWQRDEGWYANDLRDEALIDAVGLRDYMEPLGLRTLALMPMIVGRRRIGMVQVANLQNGEPFGPQELQRLRVFAAQAAVVVESVRLFDRDRDRQEEFEALQTFSLEAGRFADNAALYSAASERLAGLLRAEMAGVLDYDAAQHVLGAHSTFYGVDPRVQQYIRIPVAPGSPFARLWQEESVWVCNDLDRDPVAQAAGLSDLTSWVGIRQALLVPLVVRGQAVGALLASNKQNGGGFTRQDARLAAIFAAQLAVAHENSRLLAEVQAHVNEARGLRQISEIMGQHLPLHDLIGQVLKQVATFFDSRLAFVQFLDDTTGELKVLPEHVYGAALDAPVITDAYGPDFEQSVVMTGRPLLNNALAAEAFLLPMYQPVIAAFDLKGAIVAPLHAGGDKLGELVVANRVRGEFSLADLDRLTPIAVQLSAAVERLRLVQMTDATLWRRTGELTALERVSNVLAQTVEIERITQVIQQEALRVTGGDGCAVLMLSPTEEWADIEQPEVMQRYGDLPDQAAAAGQLVAIERAALEAGAPVIVEDYATTDLDPGPDWAVSAVAAPVMYDQRVVGVVHLFSRRAGTFDAGTETFVQALAGKAATAYLNAARFREQISRNQLLSRRVEQLNELYALGQALRAGQDIDDLLDAVAHAVQLTSGFDVVLVSIYDEALGGFRRASQAGIPLATFEELRQVILTREQVESVLQEEFRLGQSYFLPAEREADWRSALRDGDFIYHDEYVDGETGGRWHPDDALVVPLRDTRGELLGIMSVDAPVDGRRPIRTTLEPLEVFAQQAAIGIENFRLVQAIQREADAARRERDVLERLYAVSNDIQRAEDVPGRLQVVARGIRSAGWRRVHITLRGADMEPTTLISEGYTPVEEDTLHTRLVPGDELRRWLSDPEFYDLRLGTAFYLRHDAPWVVTHLRDGQAPADPAPPDRWHPEDQVILPIFGTDTHLIGLISMEEPANGQAPSEATMRPIALFAGQAASAIETTRLYQETSRAAEQEALFNEMMQAVTSTLDVNRIVRAIADGLQRFLPFTRMTVAQYNPATGNLDSIRAKFTGVDRLEVHPDRATFTQDSLLGEIFVRGQGRIMHLEDQPPRSEHTDLRQWWDEGQRSLMIVPMMVGGGVVGVMALGSELGRTYGFDHDTMQLVQRVANLGSVAMENARLYQQTAERERFSAALVRLGNELNATLDLSTTLQSICRESLEILNVDGAYIWQLERDELVGIAGVGPGSEAFVGMRQPLTDDRALAVRVFETQGTITASQADDEPALEITLPEAVTAQAYMGVPLLREGLALGVLIVVRTESTFDFTAEEVQRSAIFATQASIAVENARLYQEMIDLQSYTGAIVESIQQGIVVLSREGQITTFNDAMRRQYGWDATAAGQHLFAYRPAYEALLGEGLQQVLGSGRPYVNFNVPGETPEGAPNIQNFYLYPLEQRQQVTGIVLLLEDVTERARLEADLATRAEQLAALTAISSRLTATLEPDEVITLVLDQLGAVVQYDGVTLWLREGDNLRIASARGYGGTAADLIGLVVALEDSVLFRDIAEHQQPVYVPDVRKDARFPASEHRPTLSWLGAPLVSKGEILGLLALDKAEPESYTPSDAQLALAFANQAAVALENARLFADARRRTSDLTEQTERLGLLNRVSTKLAQSLDIENIFEVALQESVYALGLAQGRAVHFEPAHHIGRVIVEVPRGDAPPTELIPLDDNPAIDHLRETLQPLVVTNAASEPLLDTLRETLQERQVASVVLLPLIVGRQVIGMLILEATGETRAFLRDQLDIVRTIAGQAAIAAQNANLLEQSYVRTRELETLFEASQATALTLDLDEVIQSVAHQMLHALGADGCAVMLWDEVEQDLIVYADMNLQNSPALQTPVGTVYPLRDYPLRRHLLETREVAILGQGEDDAPTENAEMERLGSQSRMLVPLVVRDNAIGLVRIDLFGAFRAFGLSEQRIARTLAGQAAIAIENARLNSETAAQVQEAFMINDLSRAVSAAVDMRELFPLVRTQVSALTRAEELYLALYDPREDVLSFPVAMARGQGLDLPDRALGDDEFSWIISSNRPLLLVGEELVDVRRNLRIQTMLPEAASFLGVPLDLGMQAVGVLAVADCQRSRAFGLNEQRILTTVASQLAVAIQNANLFSELRNFNQQLEQRVLAATEEVRAERDRLNVLYTITAELSATLDLDRVLGRALDLLSQAVGAEQGLILLVDPQRERLYKRAALGEDISGPGPEGGLQLNEGLAGWVVANRKSIVVEDVQQDPRWLQVAEFQPPRAALAVLLETSDDVLGVLLLFSTRAGVFNADHLRLVEAACNQLATSVNNAELYTFIREQAERLGEMVREQQIESSKSNAVLEGVADGVAFASEQGEILLFNSAAERVLGVKRGEILGRPINRLKGLFTAGGERWVETIERWMADPQAVRAGDYFTETAEKDGRIINLTLAPVTIGDQFLGAVSVLRDITRDVEVDRMKTEFISNVSHELRTPMTSIKGYADLLVMGAAGEINERQREFLSTIKGNADRLSTLVNDLLNISRIDSGSAVMNAQQVNLNHLLGGVVAHVRSQIQAHNRAITLVNEIAPDLPSTYADADKLTQVFTNLVDNAYQYTPDDGKITVAARLDGEGRLLVTVSDTGIGIPEQMLPRVFERFFRNDEHPLVMETPGTGLGLALSKELIEMHNGRISVESEVGRGTTFYVSLPLVSAPPAEEPISLESGAV